MKKGEEELKWKRISPNGNKWNWLNMPSVDSTLPKRFSLSFRHEKPSRIEKQISRAESKQQQKANKEEKNQFTSCFDQEKKQRKLEITY
jgi:hypothetical protein